MILVWKRLCVVQTCEIVLSSFQKACIPIEMKLGLCYLRLLRSFQCVNGRPWAVNTTTSLDSESMACIYVCLCRKRRFGMSRMLMVKALSMEIKSKVAMQEEIKEMELIRKSNHFNHSCYFSSFEWNLFPFPFDFCIKIEKLSTIFMPPWMKKTHH